MDPKKTIDIAKIIKNEERLRLKVQSLIKKIIVLNDSINKVKIKHSHSLDIINKLSSLTNKQYEDIDNLNKQNLYIEKKKGSNGYYVLFAVGSDLNNLKTFDLGLNLVRSKKIYSLSIDFNNKEKPIYKIGLGLRIW